MTNGKGRLLQAAAAIGAALVLGSMFSGGLPASANTDVLPGSASQFESGDGDMTVDGAGFTDWNCFTGTSNFQPGQPSSDCLKTTGATETPADLSGEIKLTSGTKFDNPCLTYTTSNTPPKDDFTNIAEYSDTAVSGATAGDTYLYAAAIRSTNNGNASGNVEFNQATGGCRSPGDKLVAYDFLNGGTSLSFHVLTWVSSGTCYVGSDTAPCWGPPASPLSTYFNGLSNQSTITAADNGINGQALGVNQFMEFGADLTKVLQLTGCTNFPQNVFESRSSGSSFTSNPEDIEVQTTAIQTCGEITIIKQTDPRGQNQLFNFTSTLPANSTAGGVACSVGATAGVQSDGSFCLNDTGNAGKILGSTATADNSTANTIDESNVPRGTYSVTEGAEPASFVFESLTCSADTTSGSSFTVSGETATISLQSSGHVTCVYENEEQFTPSLSTAAGLSATASATSATSCPAITAGTRVAIGSYACDTAILSGTSATGVAGTVTYTLYTGTGCNNNTPTGSVVSSSQEPVGDTGTVPPSATVQVNTAGDYQWQAVFASSNTRNLGATSPCGSETFTVGPNSPSLATIAGSDTGTGVLPGGSTPDANSDAGCAAFTGSLSIGAKVCDTSTLSGFATPVAGTVTYSLYFAGVTGTTPNANSCSNGTPGGTVVFTDVQTASSTGTIPNSADFSIASAGSYQWQAAFASTNGQNNGATSLCGSEQFTVNPQSPTLTTAAGTGGTTPSTTSDASCTTLTSAPLTIGTNVCDTASLSGTAAPVAGTVTYRLYYAGTSGTTPNANSCNNNAPGGTVVFTYVETISSAAIPNSADYTVTSAGNYQWQAVFSSTNAQNVGATSACSTEQFAVGPNSPTLTTTAGTGSGVLPSGATPDTNSDGSCAALSGTLAINTNVCDTATLGGAATPVAGTVTYRLYYAGVTGTTPNLNSCSGGAPGGTLVFTDVQTVAITGSVPNSADYKVTSAGNYQWQAVFSSTNFQNNGATSTCNTETLTVGPNSPTLTTTAGTGSGVLPSGATPDTNSDGSCAAVSGTLAINTNVCDTAALAGAATPVAGTVTYSLYYAGVTGTTPTANSCAVTGTPNGTIVFTDVQTVGTTGTVPNSADYSAASAGNYQWQAVFTSTNAQNNGATSACNTETFTVGPNSPTLTTTAGAGSGVAPSGSTPDTNSDASCTALTGSVAINANVCDTATLHGVATPAAGTVTYNLYYAGATGTTPNANTCSVGGTPNGALLFSDVQTVASNGGVPNSTDYTVTNAGNYQWQVSFTSTNAQNLSATSTCLTETLTVAPNSPSMTTAQNLLPNDSANLTGATSTAGGTLTFDLYNPTNTTCSGTGDYHEVVTVSGNSIYKTDNTVDTTDVLAAAASVSPVGEWRWQVVYSGDLNNTPFTVTCGVENFIIAN